MDIKVDARLKSQLWPLEPIEFSRLEQSLIAEGCRDSLVVWRDEGILVDGHNRYEICTANGIGFQVREQDFESREAVEDWIDKNQAARRNCTPEQYKIISGRIYNRRKKAAGAPVGNSNAKQLDQVDPVVSDSTAAEVASELGISPGTVKRNGQRAEVHDALLEQGDIEAAEAARKAPQSVIGEAKKSPEQAAEILKKPHVAQNSGEQDWYTPPLYLDAARAVLGGIDTDPASSDVAQRFVQALTYFTKEDDGLNQEWRGRVWLNPPYASGLVEKFAEKLIDSLDGVCDSAVVLVNNATETRWFQLLARHADAICLPLGRIRFLDSTGKPKQSPLQGQAFFYFGVQVDSFAEHFDEIGCVFTPNNAGR